MYYTLHNSIVYTYTHTLLLSIKVDGHSLRQNEAQLNTAKNL